MPAPQFTGPARFYALAVALVALAHGLSLLAREFHLENLVTPLFLMAISAAAWYGGPGPGALAVLLGGTAMVYYFVEPLHTFSIDEEERLYFIIFIGFAVLISWFGAKRRRAEAGLRRARDELEALVKVRTEQARLLDLTHDTIFVRGMDDLVSYWNRGAQELFGWSAQDAIGQNAHVLLKTQFPVPVQALQEELLRNGRWDGELVKTRADGTQIVVASRWSLSRDEQGAPVAILETNNDITQRRRSEESIRKLNADLERRSIELEASNRELEAFAYSTSHDLRAPLRHLVGYSELLRKNAFATMDDKSRRYVNMILEAGTRMGKLIDDLLSFSRIGRTETQHTLVNLGTVVAEVRDGLESEAEGRRIEWKIAPLPSVYGDRAMLRQALINLLANAVKFTRDREPACIEVGATESADEITLFVKDNGVGFDMRYVHKLFGVFQRLHGSEEFEGTGIGLASVQRIMSRHGGRVWAEGAVGQGASFYVSIPKT
jgi:PAS domain S-box-containing protein